MAVHHKCIRGCFYLQRLWRPGEIIEETKGFEGAPPNKHFAAIGSPEAMGAGVEKAKTAGDDPRSTKEMLAALKEFDGSVSEKLSRKQIFAKLIEFENDSPGTTQKDKEATGHPDVIDPLDGKVLASMTPDELEKVKADEWRACLLARYGVTMPVRAGKPDLVERAILEEINHDKDQHHDTTK